MRYEVYGAASYNRCMDYSELYRSKLCTAEEAVSAVRSGHHIYIHSNGAAPLGLLEALNRRCDELENVTASHLLTLGPLDYLDAAHDIVEGTACRQRIRHQSWFASANSRAAVNSGRADWVPVHLGHIAELIYSGRVSFDVLLLQLSPPDAHGYCSLGVAVEVAPAALRMGGMVLAEINPRMPRALGECFVHISHLDRIVEVDHELPELEAPQITSAHRAVAGHVAELIGDGDCLQTGIGALPDAVLSLLGDRRDLGIHTELFSDGAVELVEQGVITGDRKTINRGKVVAGFVLGSRRVYDFIDNNPMVEMRPQEYVNDPYNIGRNDNMVAINSALQIDLTGQVVADNLGREIVSGIGGQMDFIRGSALSVGGKPIIALPSMARSGTVSRIVPALRPGAGVVTTRGHVHWVVTEYGAVNLHGLTIRERGEALISIAHPDTRVELRREMRQIHHV
jgi:4-hydroxybutyrate CoA-transferase